MTNLITRIASNFGWTVVSEGVSKGIFFFINLYLARVLGVENYGIFAGVQAFVYYIWLTVDLGTNMYGIKEISHHRENPQEIINSLFGLRISAGILVYLATVAGLFLFGIEENIMDVGVAAGFYLVSYAFYPDWVLKGLERFKLVAFGNIASSVTIALLVVWLVKNNDDLIKASWAWSTSYIAGALVMWLSITFYLGIRIQPDVDVSKWHGHLKSSIFFTLSGAMMMITQYYPILLLGLLSGSYEVGLFSAPYKIVFAVSSIGFFLPMAFYPVLAQEYKRDIEKFSMLARRMRIVMIIIGLPLGIAASVFASEMSNLLLGEKYSASSPVLSLLAWLIPLYLIRFSYGIPLAASGYQNFHFKASNVAVVVMLTFGSVAVGVYDVKGGALALIVSEISMILSLAIKYQKVL